MKRLMATSLSVMLLFATASNPAQAQTQNEKEVSVNSTLHNNNSSNIYGKLTPFNLISLSYQGYFKNQGIPSYGSFVAEYHQMNIQAIDLVKAGIQAHLLPADTLTNQEYIKAVDSQLFAFSSQG